MYRFLEIITGSKIFKNLKDNILKGETREIFGSTPSFKPFLFAALAVDGGRDILWLTSSWESTEKLFEAVHPYLPDSLKGSLLVFPEFQETGDQDISPALRMKALQNLTQKKRSFLIAPFKSILQNCEDTQELEKDARLLNVGDEFSLETLQTHMENLGYRRNYEVERRGEYAIRGGILDIYPSTGDPVRIEFFGDEIQSIRPFNLDTQLSTGKIQSVCIFQERESRREKNLLDIMPADTLIMVDDPPVIKFRATERNFDEGRDLWEEFQFALLKKKTVEIASWSGEEGQGTAFVTRPGDSFGANIEKFIETLRQWQEQGDRIVISSQQTPRFKEIFREKRIPGFILSPDQLPQPGEILLIPGDIHEGFYWLDEKFKLITDKEILSATLRKKRVLRTWDRTKAVNLSELKPGDKVVHLSHGVGKFLGLVQLKIQNTLKDFVELEYHKGDKLYVPVESLDMLQKYVGSESQLNNLSRLGGSEWAKTKAKVKQSAQDMAQELLELYAKREKTRAFACLPDGALQWELEATFPYDETPDQEKVIDEVKKDLESTRPMDRLVCGDVGYGKTEVALRAAFKVAQEGKQVAVLVPTTVLAVQHYENFLTRMKTFPVNVEMLSRFLSRKEQRTILEKLNSKEVDIVVGTHMLLSKEVKFKDLGLLIVDEEQHFGVAQKEKLKRLKENIHVLTMSATPIPRTLHLSLSGIRDMSLIETPPADRLPIKTYLMEYDKELIRAAVIRELERGGQVYFVHNRVQGIEKYAQEIRNLVPFAKVAIGHGQMKEDELELLMLDFMEGKFDVLVCTTIIESGLDIPNVNTIFINNAHHFGLAQLYQLRGRVGRSNHQAFAYMLYPSHIELTADAEMRLSAIRDFSQLGAGYQIAIKDMEIRGAGNILGAEQSGYIASVGFDLYCQLLNEAVEEAQGITRERQMEAPVIDLPVNYFIPDHYISDSRVKLETYRKISKIEKIEDIACIVKELRDRFGKIPIEIEYLLEILKIKLLAWDLGASQVKEIQGKIHITLPDIKNISLKNIQELYDKTRVRSYFYRNQLIIPDLVLRPPRKKTLLPQPEKVPPDVWLPQLINALTLLLDWKHHKKI